MKRKMKCPYCRHIFEITHNQKADNSRYKCPSCGKYNYGSVMADDNGVLIGITKEALITLRNATVLTMKCGWCKKPLGTKDGKGISGTSDGMCQECYDIEMSKLEVKQNESPEKPR